MSNQRTLNHFMGLVEDVKQGNRNALDVAPKLKEFSDSISELYDELKPYIVEERDKYNDKEDVVRDGYEIRTQSRTYYKYKQNEAYDFLNQKLKNKKKFIKKATDKGEEIFDPETGETIKPVETTQTRYPVLKWVGKEI